MFKFIGTVMLYLVTIGTMLAVSAAMIEIVLEKHNPVTCPVEEPAVEEEKPRVVQIEISDLYDNFPLNQTTNLLDEIFADGIISDEEAVLLDEMDKRFNPPAVRWNFGPTDYEDYL